MAQANRSRSSVAPSCLPAIVKGGHGTPPAKRSTPAYAAGSRRRGWPVADRDLPVRPVVPEGGGGVLVELDGQVVLEPRELKPERLPARAGADLHHTKPRQADLLDARSPLDHPIIPQNRPCRDRGSDTALFAAVDPRSGNRRQLRRRKHGEMGFFAGNYGSIPGMTHDPPRCAAILAARAPAVLCS